MSVEVIAIGGYQEVGKNMTAVKIGEDVIIFDMGIHLDRISMHEDTDIDRMHSLDLIERGVIPDDTLMKDVDGKVKGIVFSHGHLDHIGAVAKLAHRYDAPLIGTPYTAALIEKQIKGERKFKVKNPIKVLNPGGKIKLSKSITLECKEGSSAETFAKENQINYSIIKDYITGDLNKDGKITITDLLILKKDLVGIEKIKSEDKKRADINEDGKITITDLLILKKKLVGIE